MKWYKNIMGMILLYTKALGGMFSYIITYVITFEISYGTMYAITYITTKVITNVIYDARNYEHNFR